MGSLVVVIPLYKMSPDFAGSIADEVADLAGARVRFDLIREVFGFSQRPDDGDIPVRRVLDWLARNSTAQVAARLIEAAESGPVTISAAGTGEYPSRPETVPALIALARTLAEQAGGCVVLTPWWTDPQSGGMGFRQIVAASDLAIGVLEVSDDTCEGGLEQGVASALFDASEGSAAFVVHRWSVEVPLLPPFDDPRRTLVIDSDTQHPGAAVREKLAEFLGSP